MILNNQLNVVRDHRQPWARKRISVLAFVQLKIFYFVLILVNNIVNSCFCKFNLCLFRLNYVDYVLKLMNVYFKLIINT